MKIKHPLRNFIAAFGTATLAISSASAQVDGTWNAQAGNWSVSDNWLDSPDPVPGGAGSIINLTNNITANSTVTIDTDSRTVGQLTIGDSDNSNFFTLASSGGAELIFNNNGNGATLTSTNGIVGLTGSARDTIDAPVTLDDNLAVSVAGTYSGGISTGYLAMAGNIGDSGGAKTITKSGNGSLLLTGNNTYSGGFILNGGSVQVTASNNQVVNPYTGFGTGTLTINGGTIATRSAGSFTTDNDSVWNANFALWRGQTGTATWNHQGDVTLNADITPILPNNFFALNISGDIGETGGARSLTISSGAFTMTLSGDNTYSGGTTLSAGRLNLGSATALGDGALAINGGIIDNTSGSPLTVADYTIGANFTFGGTNNLTLTGDFVNPTNNRAITLQGTNSTLTIDGIYVNSQNNNQNFVVTGPGNTLVLGGLALSHNATSRTVTVQGTGNLTVTGAVTNGGTAASGNLVKGSASTHTGTLRLAGSNTYAGTTTINFGTLVITGATQATSAITLNGGSLGLDTGFPVTAAAAAVNLANGTITVTGNTGAPSYTLLTAASITGTPVLADPVPGYELQLAAGDTELRLVQTGGSGTPYEDWATGGELFEDDANGDGVSNGLAFLLGATGPNDNALGLLPIATETAGGLVLTFNMLDAASRGAATLSIEHSSDLGISDAWITVAVPDSTGGPTDGVSFTVTGSGTLNIEATISSTEADAGKLFSRLKVEQN